MPPFKSISTPFALFAMLFGAATAFSLSAHAQEALAPPPLEFTQPAPGLRSFSTNQPLMPPLIQVPPEQLEWGPVQFHPHLLYRFLYGDGIPAGPNDHVTTAINEISPGVLLTLGSHWRLDYTPTLRYYSSSKFKDADDHSVSLDGSTAYNDWSFNLAQRVSLTSTPLIETAAQTDQQNYDTVLNAVYFMNSKLSLELGLSQDLRFVDQNAEVTSINNSLQWSTTDWLNYQFLPTFGAAIGVGFGYDQVDPGSDMTFEQLQGRLNWHPNDKCSVLLSGGFEVRQFLDSNASDLVSPLVGFSGQYKLFEQTTLSLNVNHSVNPSYIADNVTETTDFNGAIRQRLLGKLYLDVSGGYRVTDYHATLAGVSENRHDDYTFVSVRLTAPFLQRGTFSVFYMGSDNHSNESDFAVTSNQVGFEVGWRY